MFKKILYGSLILTALTSAVAYAEVSIETAVSRSRVPVGEEIKLDIIVSEANGPVSKPTISSIAGFSSYSQGHSQEISIINGQMSSRSIFSYVLIANEVGRKTIGPFQIKIGDKIFNVAAVEVEVLPTGSSLASSAAGAMQSLPSMPVSAPSARALPKANISNQDIFVKAWLDKDEVYVNEPVILTYTIYTRLSATYKGFEKEPVTTGFWVEDFPPEKNIRRTEQVFNGSRYVVADVRKLSLFPTQAGVFTVDPGVLSAMVETRSQDSFNSFFSSNVFGYRAQRMPSSFLTEVISRSIPTDPVTIAVKTLPEAGKPENFSGAVGDYRIQSSLDKSQVEAGTPVTYRVRIEGRGNVNIVEVPPVPKMGDFKIYDSSSSVNISKERFTVEGSKVVETVLVPKKEGSYKIPPIQFSFFDPATQSYKKIETSAHELQVTPASDSAENGGNVSESQGVEEVLKQNVALIAKDIRFIKKESKPAPRFLGWHRNVWYWIFHGLVLMLSFVLLYLLGQKNSLKDLKGHRYRRSHSVARKKLRGAESLLRKEDEEAFYAELSKILNGYFGDKLNISSQKVNAEEIAKILPATEEGSQVLSEIRLLFNELSFGRFAKSEKDLNAMKKVYEAADRVITQFERLKIK